MYLQLVVLLEQKCSNTNKWKYEVTLASRLSVARKVNYDGFYQKRCKEIKKVSAKGSYDVRR